MTKAGEGPTASDGWLVAPSWSLLLLGYLIMFWEVGQAFHHILPVIVTNADETNKVYPALSQLAFCIGTKAPLGKRRSTAFTSDITAQSHELIDIIVAALVIYRITSVQHLAELLLSRFTKPFMICAMTYVSENRLQQAEGVV
eukprot:CAMPEP_0181401308 /NCGR_PEP_ID=MMETSP1110-20121109/2581_1 /TAXON_ID=174948 /ORGANISM="Symbiodinium sp., Strain CCMP421" /LENGTH=142 /DNA_ID=CAMNT_0023523469 /DNA_START=109 /DNA_END=538 /DNA_ORIENTATION=+